MVTGMGFNSLITEGAKHILGWKSPNYMYCSARNPKLKLLLRNFRLSDDIAFRFSTHTWPEWPLTAEKFTGWLNGIESREELVNVFLDYETIGERQWKETGIFNFFTALPKVVLSNSNFNFSTPSELIDVLQPVAQLHVPHPISWADEERDLTSWLGNELQDEAFLKLYSLTDRIQNLRDPDIERDWQYLQTTDHFYYMCTKWFSDGTIHKYFNPYPSPYEAFINYMNVLSDFTIRVDEATEKKNEKVPKKVKKAETRKTPVKVTKAPVKLIRKTEDEKVLKSNNFDSIIALSDSKIKKVVKSLEIETVSIAMKGANKEIKAKVEKNLGKRALKTFKEFSQQTKKISEAEIKKSRKLLEKQIKLLTK
jgi:alpha-amylase